MSDQFDPAIADLIDTGRRKLKAASDAQQQREHAKACERQSAIAARASEAREALGNLLPDALCYYAGRCSEIEPEGWNDVIYRLEIPGCSAITITLKREQTGIVDGQYTYAYKPSTNYKNGIERGIYCVDYLDVVERYDDGDLAGYVAGENGHHGYTDDLSVALASAAEQGAKMDTLSAMAVVKTAELKSREIVRQAAADQRQDRETADRDTLFDLIVNDPVAVALLKVFTAIKQERAGYAESVESLSEALDSQSDRYQRQLAEQQHQADLALRTRQNEVDIAQREADELQGKLDKIKRHAQFA